MIKVVHITTSIKGGAGIAALRLHEALNQRGTVSSSILQKYEIDENPSKNIFHVPFPRESFLFKILRKLGLKNRVEHSTERKATLAQPRNYEIITFPQTSYRIENHPIISEADIVHLHWVGDFVNYETFFKEIKKPIIWTLHDMNPFQGIFHYKNDEENNLLFLGDADRKNLMIKNTALQKVKNLTIICLCRWMKERSVESKVFRNINHVIIPNALNENQFSNNSPTNPKVQYGINNGLKTFMFIAGDVTNYRKGFDLFIKIIETLNIKINILTVGGNSFKLPEFVNHIHFGRIDNEDQINSIYSASDLVLITSREDNLPNVMLESFANGTPVASFAVGGMKDYIKEGETGFLVNSYDVIEFSKKLRKFNDDEIVFDRVKIKEFARSNFDGNLIAEKMTKLYQEKLNP